MRTKVVIALLLFAAIAPVVFTGIAHTAVIATVNAVKTLVDGGHG